MKQLADIVGEYYVGDGVSSFARLTLSIDGECTLGVAGHLDAYRKYRGTVRNENDGVVVNIRGLPSSTANRILGNGKLIVIRWANRRYLLKQTELAGFCNYVNQGIEPRDKVEGRHFLRIGDHKLDPQCLVIAEI